MNQNFSASQQAILDTLLKETDGLSVDALVEQIGVTKTAIKEHLIYLEGLSLVESRDERIGVGRPRKLYTLAPEGREVFPRQYSWFSTQMLELMSQTMSEEQLGDFMRQLADRVYQGVGDLSCLSTAERIKALVKLMNDLGYRARLVPQSKQEPTRLEAFNCVYHQVAQQHTTICQFDTQLISNATGMQVQMESCIAKGGSSCRFCLKKS